MLKQEIYLHVFSVKFKLDTNLFLIKQMKIY